MDKTIEKLNGQLNTTLKPMFENKYFVAGLGLGFALYAGMLAPKLPNSVLYFFDSIPGKFLFIFLIAFLASRDLPNSLQTALIISFVFLIGLTTLSNIKLKEQFKNIQAVEDFSDNVREEFSIRDNIYMPLIETLESEINELKNG
jgi:hypothetical protein